MRRPVRRRRSFKRLCWHATPLTPAGNLVERPRGTDPNAAYTDYVSDTAVYDAYGVSAMIRMYLSGHNKNVLSYVCNGRCLDREPGRDMQPT